MSIFAAVVILELQMLFVYFVNTTSKYQNVNVWSFYVAL